MNGVRSRTVASVLFLFLLPLSLFGHFPHQDLHQKIEMTKIVLQQTDNVESRIDLLCDLADFYLSVSPDSGLIHGRQALSLSYANDYLKGKINAHDRLGFLYQSLGKFDDATEHLVTALQLSELSPDSSKKIDILNHLGSIRYNQNTEQSLEYYLQALRLSEKVNDKRRVASSYNHIGTIYYQQKNYEKALEYNLRSLDAWSRIDSMAATGVLSDIGNIYLRLLDYKSALAYYQRANRIAAKNGDYLGMGYTSANIGIAYLEMGNMPESLQKLKESLAHRQMIDNQEGISNSLAMIARWYYTQKEYGEAYAYAKKNFDLARSIGIKRTTLDAYEIMVDILTAQQRFPEAIQFQREWIAYKDSVMLRENTAQLARLEVVYETEKKETENALLKEQKATTEAVLGRQIVLTVFAAVMLLMTGVGILLLYRSNRSKQAVNKRLQKQNDIIRQQKEQLESLHRVKDKLFSILTHDLRGPVSSLRMFISYLRDEDLDQQMIKEYTKQSSATMDQIMSLMENVLLWSKNQWTGLTVEPTMINLHQIVKEKIRVMEPEAAAKGIVLQNSIPAATQAYADQQMIDLVFRNLISNAVKFTDNNGTVRIHCAEYDDYVEVSVQDTGIGLSADQLRTIFMFDETPHKGTREKIGTGLGLVLCKEFVEKNGGTITAESVEGAGSVFTFTLPRTKIPEHQRSAETV